jgi:hypothetical protein
MLFRLDAARQRATIILTLVKIPHLKPSPFGLLYVEHAQGTVGIVPGTEV